MLPFDGKTGQLRTLFGDYSTRFPSNLLLRQTTAFYPRGKNPTVLCSLRLSHSNTLLPNSPDPKAPLLSLTESSSFNPIS